MGALEARAEDAQGDMVRRALLSLTDGLCSCGMRDVCRSECDPAGTGSLDLEGFIRGMWRIDEELRRAQLRSGLGLALGRHGSIASMTSRGRARVAEAGRGCSCDSRAVQVMD
ncbi:uncharacterized protein B0H18DRAFT_135254 [Fomitopsis serialis]|uniref:uncharacterized protein n=1 Tax=Fomitopsis serialis TaxID=139415 RepID=UPI0020088328|nr:uncharacterized protein B0H18DRAFT_135254 [Neoantrodia serialis]KAH9930774.1 hypothetical protein B0H18DRAFT_135254 [Neoantrodia serialis]